jgi:2-oxoglutarate ferredoxin oxidoreductase subunit gamma
MRNSLRFTGVGGQGVLLAGEIMAACKIKNGGFGLKTATYTSQVRGGATVVDKAWKIIEIPIITIAKEEVGNVITQSVVAMSITNTLTGVLPEESLIEVMLSKVPAKVHAANILAYELGKKYALEKMGK